MKPMSLALIIALSVSHSAWAAQKAGVKFCDYLFVRTSERAFPKQTGNGYSIYEDRENKKLIARIKTAGKAGEQQELLSIEGSGGNQLAQVPAGMKISGVVFNNGTFHEPVACGKIARLVALEPGKVRFISAIDPKTSY